jgi:hypothetical protein
MNKPISNYHIMNVKSDQKLNLGSKTDRVFQRFTLKHDKFC